MVVDLNKPNGTVYFGYSGFMMSVAVLEGNRF